MKQIAPSYLDPIALREAIINACGEGGRAWKHGKHWRSVRTRSKRAKILWTGRAEIDEIIEACARFPKQFGTSPAPSSYAWPWLRSHTPTRWSQASDGFVSRDFSLPYSWGEAIRPGNYVGKFALYDVNRAYAWASLQGLPDTTSAVYCDRQRMRRGALGLYLVSVSEWRVPLVHPRLRTDQPVWVTREEFERCAPAGVTIHRGIEWTRKTSVESTFARLERILPAHAFKKMCQAHWGAWGSQQRTAEWSLSRSGPAEKRRMPLRFYCPAWAWTILARVSLRLLDYSHPFHVYTDSILAPLGALDTGSAWGQWKLSKTFDDLWVSATGQFGDRNTVYAHMGTRGTEVLAPGVYIDRAKTLSHTRESGC